MDNSLKGHSEIVGAFVKADEEFSKEFGKSGFNGIKDFFRKIDGYKVNLIRWAENVNPDFSKSNVIPEQKEIESHSDKYSTMRNFTGGLKNISTSKERILKEVEILNKALDRFIDRQKLVLPTS